MAKKNDPNLFSPQLGLLGLELQQAVQARDMVAVKALVAAGADPSSPRHTPEDCAYNRLVNMLQEHIKAFQDGKGDEAVVKNIKQDMEILEILLLGSRIPMKSNSNYKDLSLRTSALLEPKKYGNIVGFYNEVFTLNDAIQSYSYIMQHVLGNESGVFEDIVDNHKLTWFTAGEDAVYIGLRKDIRDAFHTIRYGAPELYREMMHDDAIWHSREDAKRWMDYISQKITAPPSEPMPAWRLRRLDEDTRKTALGRYLSGDPEKRER